MVTLREELDTFTRKLTWRIRVRAAIQAVSVIAVTAFALGWVDFYLRPELSLVRHILSIFFWGIVIATILHRLIPAWSKKINPVDVAFAIEENSSRVPGELAAVVDFDRTSSSANEQSEWQQAVIQRVFEATPQHSPRLRSQGMVVYGLLLTATLFVVFTFATSTTVIAMTRIAWPRSEQKWPQMTKLVVYDKKQNVVSPGSIFSVVGITSTEFQVVDELGAPPEDLMLEIRRPSLPLKRIRLRQNHQKRIIRDSRSLDVFDFRLIPNAKETMQFRVIGGDDRSMAWITVRRETKPLVQGISCLITPPEYLASEPKTLENWAGLLTAPVGAKLTFDVVMNRPIVEYELRSADGAASQQDTLTGSQFSFELEVTTNDEKELSYDLFVRTEKPVVTETEFTTSWERVKRIRLEPIVDFPPEVTLILPQRDLTVTQNAVIPLKATTRDDYGLASFSIEIVSDETFSFESEDVENKLESSLSGNLTIKPSYANTGSVIEVFAKAFDHSPSASPVLSSTVKLSVVTEKSKEQELHEKLKQIASTLLAAYENQRIVIQETQQLLDWSQASETQEQGTETLKLIQLKQLVVQETLRNRVEQELVTFIVQHFEMNRLNNSTLKEAISTVDSGVAQLINNELENCVVSLDSFRNSLKETDNLSSFENRKTEFRRGILPVLEQQESASEALAELIQKLDRWIVSTNIQVQWRHLHSSLKAQMIELSSIAQVTASKPLTELTNVQRNRLQKSSEAHFALSKKTQSLATSLSNVESQSWQQLGKKLLEFQTSAKLQEAARAIQNNNVLKAAELDRDLHRALSEFEAQRSRLRVNDTAKLFSQLQEYRGQLKEISEKQVDLSSKWRDSPFEKSHWGQQRRLRQSMLHLVQQFDQHGMNPAAELLTEATVVVDRTLRDLESLQDTDFHSNLALIEEKINASISLVSDSIRKIQEKNQNIILRELSLLMRHLLKQHEVHQQTVSVIEQSYSENRRITRTQRRELMELSRTQRSSIDQLLPFQNASEELPVISQRLDSLISATEEASLKLRHAELGPNLNQQMTQIHSLLAQLSSLDRTEKGEVSEINEFSIPQHVRAQIQILIARQRELVGREKSLLKDGQIIPEKIQNSISTEQKEILDVLKNLLKGIDDHGQKTPTQ